MGAEVSGVSIARIAGSTENIRKTVAFRGELSVLCVVTYIVTYLFDADPYFFRGSALCFL